MYSFNLPISFLPELTPSPDLAFFRPNHFLATTSMVSSWRRISDETIDSGHSVSVGIFNERRFAKIPRVDYPVDR